MLASLFKNEKCFSGWVCPKCTLKKAFKRMVYNNISFSLFKKMSLHTAHSAYGGYLIAK